MQITCRDFDIDLLNENIAARKTLETLMTVENFDLVCLLEANRQTVASSTSIDSIYSNVFVLASQMKKKVFSLIVSAYKYLSIYIMSLQKTSLNIDP